MSALPAILQQLFNQPPETPQAAGGLDNGLIGQALQDRLGQPELTNLVPGSPSPEQSFLDYQCEILPDLDPGTILHKPLPQTTRPVDTLGTYDVKDGKKGEGLSQTNINLLSSSAGIDIVQQAATSTYRFCLKGYGLRAGYPVPVPNLASFAGAECVPAWPHKILANRIVQNWNGVPIYFCAWELWYHVPQVPQASPGQGVLPVAPNLAQKTDGSPALPDAIQEPVSIQETPAGANWPTFVGSIPGIDISSTAIPK
jgi:hypothetical protein